MRKKLIIGSILVSTLLLLIPSIPAIQHRTIEERVKQDIKEKYEKIKDSLKFEALDKIKRPFLFLFVVLVAGIYYVPCMLLVYYFFEILYGKEEINFPAIHYFLFFLMFYLIYRNMQIWANWVMNWQNISDKYGWNWDFPEDPFFP
jgi:hypothetical protein